MLSGPRWLIARTFPRGFLGDRTPPTGLILIHEPADTFRFRSRKPTCFPADSLRQIGKYQRVSVSGGDFSPGRRSGPPPAWTPEETRETVCGPPRRSALR